MKYAILDENGNQIQWCNDDTVMVLPLNAVFLTDLEWENRFTNIKVSTADKIDSLKRNLIRCRKEYLIKTQNEAIEALLDTIKYPLKDKRDQAKQQIKDIEAAKTLGTLNEFNIDFK